MIVTRAAAASVSLRAIERALFAIGMALLGCYCVQRLTTVYDQAASNRELEEIRMSAPVTSISRASVHDEPARGALLGRVDLPRVGVSAIVREGDDTGTLRRAVGHIPRTALPGEPGNMALAGHRDTFFRGLRDVRNGDRIVVTTPNAVLRYDVLSTRIVEPTDVSVLEPTPGPTLTLVTCYPFNYIGSAPQRFIVQAKMAAIGDNNGRDTRRIQADDGSEPAIAAALLAPSGVVARREGGLGVGTSDRAGHRHRDRRVDSRVSAPQGRRLEQRRLLVSSRGETALPRKPRVGVGTDRDDPPRGRVKSALRKIFRPFTIRRSG
jgi:sortase A